MREAFIVGIVVLIVLLVVEKADAYNHVRPCQISMNGGHSSDNDIQKFKNTTHARGFGWEVKLNGTYRAWHGRDGSVYIVGDFLFNGGSFQRKKAHCWGGDYHGDRFV